MPSRSKTTAVTVSNSHTQKQTPIHPQEAKQTTTDPDSRKHRHHHHHHKHSGSHSHPTHIINTDGEPTHTTTEVVRPGLPMRPEVQDQSQEARHTDEQGHVLGHRHRHESGQSLPHGHGNNHRHHLGPLAEPPPHRRNLSSTEVVYPTPDAATRALEAERHAKRANGNVVHDGPTNANTLQPPLPYRIPSPFGDQTNLRPRGSDRSLRSRVSFDSTRSRRSNRSGRSARSEGSNGRGGGYKSDGGATIGPSGEAIQYIGLGIKTPKHRAVPSEMLKPALRTSRRNLRTDVESEERTELSEKRTENKPLPSRPTSRVVAHLDRPSRMRSRSRDITNRNTTGTSRHHHSLSNPHTFTGPLLPSTNGIRSLLSSFSLGGCEPFPSRASLTRLVLPAESLYTYLALAEYPIWDKWPSSGPGESRSRGLFSSRSRGFDAMGWEWMRRLEAAENGRLSRRALRFWEGSAKYWDRGVLEFVEDNVPVEPIDPSIRWGEQTFALHADGFDTVEFRSDTHDPEDNGLLSWLTASILQTAVSALHMLRGSSQTFTFHLIPSQRPPPPTARGGFKAPQSNGQAHCLWEGFGTLVLVNKSNEADRAMVLAVRPPEVVTGAVLREFSRSSKHDGWWHLPTELCTGDAGQANLLQAQVYDDCVQNQVYFFVVTTLKYWVFGTFNSSYSRCTVGPVINRRARDPSVMQCLTTWLIRAVDERPSAAVQYTVPPLQHRPRTELNSELRSRHTRSRSHSDTPSPEFHPEISTAPSGAGGGYAYAASTSPMSGVALPVYCEPVPPPLPYPQPSLYGTPGATTSHMSPHIRAGGYPTWSMGQGGSRAFSPLSAFNGVGWYTDTTGFWPSLGYGG